MSVNVVDILDRHKSLAFAENILKEHERKGGDVREAFAAFAGLVCARDATVGADCLAAFDEMISGRARQ